MLTIWIFSNCASFINKLYHRYIHRGKNVVQGSALSIALGIHWGSWNVYSPDKGEPAYLNYMQGTSCEMPVRMKLKLGSRLPGEISTTSDMQMTPPLWQKVKRN